MGSSERKHRQRQQSELEALQSRIKSLEHLLNVVDERKEKLQTMVLECLTLLIARERQLKVNSSCCCQTNVALGGTTNISVARTDTVPDELLLSQLLGSSKGILDQTGRMRTTNVSVAATLPGEDLLNDMVESPGSHDNIENLSTMYTPVAATAIIPGPSLLNQLLEGLGVTLDDYERMRTTSTRGSSVSRSFSSSGSPMETTAQSSMEGFEDHGLPSSGPDMVHSMLETMAEELGLDSFQMRDDYRNSY
ncbi:hypothetical protein N7517_009200 [Penicillium concentricum]|uniref:Uncharacterized protein n=1 Tax=Penicillium concentricum TaxID=293559 RepID=A0A9W9UX80_9EURO|nr:uncharacterized protein N7517_009200 [Penicillium concentricum]KAJ5360009.1 hypothetical protein N7517_009200 [Penicillium concentricum]